MNCRDAERQIFAERDGALDDSQRAALSSHLASCGDCRRVKNDLERFVTQWRADDAAVRVPSEDIEWRKLQRTLNGAPAGRRAVAGWFALPATLAAAAALALYLVPGNRAPGVKPEAGATIAQQEAVNPAASPPASMASTVVYTDEKSGWTFVWAPDGAGTGQQHI